MGLGGLEDCATKNFIPLFQVSDANSVDESVASIHYGGCWDFNNLQLDTCLYWDSNNLEFDTCLYTSYCPLIPVRHTI